MFSRRDFPEQITPFLKEKLKKLRKRLGEKHPHYLALARQYIKSKLEEDISPETNLYHWKAGLISNDSKSIKGIERLYRRTLVINLTKNCPAHCRYCLRQNYEPYTLSDNEIIEVSRYCGNKKLKKELNEVLITGGDPLIVPQKLNFLIESLIRYAPNISIIRVASRLPQQEPKMITKEILDIFKNKSKVRFEIATQINHPIELFPEVKECLIKLLKVVPKIYSQNVLLKGVNDNEKTLIELYDNLRSLGIEPYYLFHPAPIVGTHHFRPSVEKALKLIRGITNSGLFSGRAKPMLTLMTDIGKVTLYEGTIIRYDRKTKRILIRSSYKINERLKWNPCYKLPASAKVDKDGYLQVWYLDGKD